MPRKKVEVVELNKKEEKIVLEEKQSALILFWRRHNVLIFLTTLILSLTILGVSLLVIIKNLGINDVPKIRETSVDISLASYETMLGNNALTDESAKEQFLKNSKFKSDGEVLLVKKVEHNKFTIKYYSDGTALMILKENNRATRINPLENGDYGISNAGVISSKADTINVTVIDTKEYPWGTVNYFSDGSAEVVNSKYDIFVRNSEDVYDKYISNNKISYLKETKQIGNTKLYYYYDGTVEVVKNNQSYVVRTPDDLTISTNNVTFKNNNEATIYETKHLADGVTIDYYNDGGAIIRNGNKTISVRKSNSIFFKDDKVYEIVDSIYVTECKKANGVTYYTNGGAVVNNYDGETIYVPENSDIKYQGSTISTVSGDYEKLTNETDHVGENIKVFEYTAVVTTDEYIAIVDKDKIVYDKDGRIKEIIEVSIAKDIDGFTITNNENEKITYRVVLEQSPRTTVDPQYLRFQAIGGNKYIEPTKLTDSYWTEDNIKKELKVSGINYILLEKDLGAHATDNISVMLWTDYDTIPNSEQDKYFYGTIKVYAWTEK